MKIRIFRICMPINLMAPMPSAPFAVLQRGCFRESPEGADEMMDTVEPAGFSHLGDWFRRIAQQVGCAADAPSNQVFLEAVSGRFPELMGQMIHVEMKLPGHRVQTEVFRVMKIDVPLNFKHGAACAWHRLLQG